MQEMYNVFKGKRVNLTKLCDMINHLKCVVDMFSDKYRLINVFIGKTNLFLYVHNNRAIMRIFHYEIKLFTVETEGKKGG